MHVQCTLLDPADLLAARVGGPTYATSGICGSLVHSGWTDWSALLYELDPSSPSTCSVVSFEHDLAGIGIDQVDPITQPQNVRGNSHLATEG